MGSFPLRSITTHGHLTSLGGSVGSASRPLPQSHAAAPDGESDPPVVSPRIVHSSGSLTARLSLALRTIRPRSTLPRCSTRPSAWSPPSLSPPRRECRPHPQPVTPARFTRSPHSLATRRSPSSRAFGHSRRLAVAGLPPTAWNRPRPSASPLHSLRSFRRVGGPCGRRNE